MASDNSARKKWRKIRRAIFKCGLIQWVMVVFMSIPIWFVYWTSVKKVTNIEVFYKYRKKAAIFVIWHGRTMMLCPVVALGGMRGYAVASQHRDGRMMAKLLRLFGLRAIYGSSSKGGVSVLRNGLRVLARGDSAICMSPDGPSGPSMRIKDGAMYFAQMSGAPIIPVGFSASRAWIQPRWDKYLVALPFSKLNINIGNPFWVPRKSTPEQVDKIRREIEDFMVKQTRELDAECGIPSPEQDLKSSEFKRKRREEKAAKKAARRNKKVRG